MSQGPRRPKRPEERRPADPEAPPPTPPPQDDVLPPELGIVEPGLDEEGILIDILCRG
ncbi:hypothetical protein [Deinococcus multiflagellatus]|uniref:Uncharacterized protein n=1 Tax=Deinococcus multiflagellatus TaxID=1656887 RepID=A0ABW1ZT34_9DEIO|nr:hypothetical protein [Deinococcus multiflagellatus]MBZ9715006.1 hypothetical protein [Deinococcus multiflagellatus]